MPRPRPARRRPGPRRQAILAGKAVNAGQTCIAPDTVLLVGHRREDFIAACRATGIGLPETVMVNDRQADRLAGLCAGASLTPLAENGPGRHRAIALAEAPPGHPLHEAELFGPVLALQPLPDLAAALGWIAARPPALAIYLFGANPAERDAVAAARGAAPSSRGAASSTPPSGPRLRRHRRLRLRAAQRRGGLPRVQQPPCPRLAWRLEPFPPLRPAAHRARRAMIRRVLR
jgi:hypothetical protein